MQNAENHHHANGDEDQHGHYLDGGEPELRLAKALGRQGVEAKHDGQEQRTPQHAAGAGEPVGHDQLRGHQIDSNGDGPVVPIVPAQREAKAFVHIFGAVGRKRARDRHMGRHFAQTGHQKVHHQADDHVGQQCPAGARLRDGGARGHKQAGADRAANGDHRHMACLEGTVQATVFSFYCAIAHGVSVFLQGVCLEGFRPEKPGSSHAWAKVAAR